MSWTKTMASVFAKPKRRKQCALHKTTLLCTKPHFVDVLQTKGSDFYSMAAGFTWREAVPATVHDPCHPGYPTNTPLPSALSKPQANAVDTLPLAPLVLSAPNKEQATCQELGVECPDLQRRAVPRRGLRLGVK